jgi:hypothetical protein
MNPRDIPIILIAFDRVDYFEKVLNSLLSQRGRGIDRERVYLFRDGRVNRTSKLVKADPRALAKVSELFRNHFPVENDHSSQDNVGVALNFKKAEAFAFETLNAEIAYFLEDDLELGPDYLAQLDRMAEQAAADPRIGYFAAYGDLLKHFPQAPGAYVPLEHHWGFGLMRRHWQAMQPALARFYGILDGVDYMFRDNAAIYGWYRELGFGAEVTSQDAAKTAISASLGVARVNTKACFARYIGEKGLHMSPERFEQLGFRATSAIETAAAEPMTEANLAWIIEEQRRMAKAHVENSAEYAAQRGIPLKRWADRVVDEELATWAYRMLLLRDIESSQRVEAIVQSERRLDDFVREIVNSAEFRKRFKVAPDPT